MSKKVLVVGGTGMLGRPVAERLMKDGYQVTVMSSQPDRARKLLAGGLEVVSGDVTDVESLKTAIEGQEFIHINLNAHFDPDKYERIEIGGTANIAKVAAESGVRRVSMISSATSRGVVEGPIFQAAKVRAEQALIESSVPYTVMRPSWFFESLHFFIKDELAVVLGRQPHTRRWLAADDYVGQVVKALESDDAANKCFYCLGPESLTVMQALERYCKARHPGLTPTSMPFSQAKEMASQPQMEALARAIPFFEFFDEFEEEADSTEADRVVGRNNMSLESWLSRSS